MSCFVGAAVKCWFFGSKSWATHPLNRHWNHMHFFSESGPSAMSFRKRVVEEWRYVPQLTLLSSYVNALTLSGLSSVSLKLCKSYFQCMDGWRTFCHEFRCGYPNAFRSFSSLPLQNPSKGWQVSSYGRCCSSHAPPKIGRPEASIFRAKRAVSFRVGNPIKPTKTTILSI